MTHLPARRLDPASWPYSSRTDSGASVAPGPPALGEIYCDDTDRTEKGPTEISQIEPGN